MPTLNRALLIGNLTRDPEIKYTPRGTAIADIALAINRTRKDDVGEKQEDTTFVDVTLWGRMAEIASEYLRKGQPVLIEGRLQLDCWNDKQTGQRRSRLRVVANNLQILNSKASSNGTTGRAKHTPASAPAPNQGKPQREVNYNEYGEPEDIPF